MAPLLQNLRFNNIALLYLPDNPISLKEKSVVFLVTKRIEKKQYLQAVDMDLLFICC